MRNTLTENEMHLRSLVEMFAPCTWEQFKAAAKRALPQLSEREILEGMKTLYQGKQGFFLSDNIVRLSPYDAQAGPDFTAVRSRAVWTAIAYLTPETYPHMYRIFDRGADPVCYYSFMHIRRFSNDDGTETTVKIDYDIVSVKQDDVALANHYVSVVCRDRFAEHRRFVYCLSSFEEAEKYIMPQGHKCYFAVVTGNEVSDDLEPPVAFFEWGLES